jgi:hypothetical protein
VSQEILLTVHLEWLTNLLYGGSLQVFYFVDDSLGVRRDKVIRFSPCRKEVCWLVSEVVCDSAIPLTGGKVRSATADCRRAGRLEVIINFLVEKNIVIEFGKHLSMSA